MLTELQAKKARRLFDIYDADGDGMIELEDYLRWVADAAEIRGWDADSAQYKRLRSNAINRWIDLQKQADDDASARVTLDEYLYWTQRRLRKAQEAGDYSAFEQQAGDLFHVLDRDADDRVLLAEYEEFLVAHGLDDVDAEANFSRLDANGDGYITRDEVIALLVEFWTGDDPAAPGNYVLGAL